MDGACMNSEFVDNAASERQAWMATLASAPSGRVRAAWTAVAETHRPPVETLREPETGLVMVRGRAGGTGEQFNIGEMTVTRCAVRLDDGTVGVSYLAGRDKTHALIAATVDAMLQTDTLRSVAQEAVLAPLRAAEKTAADIQARKTEATRVNFFTMVRTRQEK